jgi:hypothetical protein
MWRDASRTSRADGHAAQRRTPHTTVPRCADDVAPLRTCRTGASPVGPSEWVYRSDVVNRDVVPKAVRLGKGDGLVVVDIVNGDVQVDEDGSCAHGSAHHHVVEDDLIVSCVRLCDCLIESSVNDQGDHVAAAVNAHHLSQVAGTPLDAVANLDPIGSDEGLHDFSVAHVDHSTTNTGQCQPQTLRGAA